MAKIKVLEAVVNGHGFGSILTVTDKEADYLEKIGYAERVVEQEKPQPKAAPKQKPKTEA